MTELDTRATFAALLEEAATCDTGCLVVTDATGSRAGRIYLRGGDVYSVRVQGFLPRLAHRLRAGGMIDDDGLRTLLQQCGGDAHALDAGEKAVASGMVDVEVLHALHRELLLSSIGAMRTWESPRTKVRRWVQTSRLTTPPISVPAVLRALDRRHERWEVLWSGLAAGAPVDSVYPRRRADAGPVPQEETASFEAEAVLAAADGTRSLDEVAGECGLTRFETGHVLAPLVAAGLVDISRERSSNIDEEEPAPDGLVAHENAPPVSPEGHLHSFGRTLAGVVEETEPRRLLLEGESSADGAEVSDPSEPADAEVTDAVLEHEWISSDDESVRPRAATGPVVIDHSDDDQAQGPRLAPDVIAANEHLDELVEPGDLEDDLPMWGDPVDSLPDGIYLQPIAIDMPEVVFEALADGVTNRAPSTSVVEEAAVEEAAVEEAAVEEAAVEEPVVEEPVVEEPVVEEPVVEEPAVEEPVVAVIEEPVVEEPVVEEPTVEEPMESGEATRDGEGRPGAVGLGDAGLRIPVPMPALDAAGTGDSGVLVPPAPEEVAGVPVGVAQTAEAGEARPAGPHDTDAPPAAVYAGDQDGTAAAVGGDAGALVADAAERIAADEAVRVQAEEDAAERTVRQAALQRARAALDAAQAEAERSEAVCEELLTTRGRVEATVSRLAEAVAASDDELSRLDEEARASAQRAEQGATDEEEARADVTEAEAAVARAAAALQAACDVQEAAMSRLVATGMSRADLDERAASALADHRNAAERSVRLKAEERLAREGAAASVRAHAAAEAFAAAARESAAEAARRLETARSRLSELD